MIEEEEMAEAATVETSPEESFERRQARLAREAYLRRAEESHREREEIYRRNGLLKEGESLPTHPAAIDAQCC